VVQIASGVKKIAFANVSSKNLVQILMEALTTSIKMNVPANATALLPLVILVSFTTPMFVPVFVHQKYAVLISTGAKNIANVSAFLKSVLSMPTGKLISMIQRHAAANANLSFVKLATIGMRISANAFALQRTAQLTSTGIASSADADAAHKTALVKPTTQFTTLRLARASVLKTLQISAKQPNISTMLSALAYVPLKLTAQMVSTGTLEFAIASQSTAAAQLVTTST
jgi:hypothetical protein